MNRKAFRRRAYVIGLCCAAVSVFLIVRLIHLHFHPRIQVSPPQNGSVLRGSIKDRNGFILALSIERDSLFANPEEIGSPEETAAALGRVLRVPPATILEKLKKKKRFVWIARRLSEADAAEVRRLNIRGLSFRKEYQRVYPHRGLAANIVGFVGIDGDGLEGIEYAYNDVLSGADVPSRDVGSVAVGRSVVLTVDRSVQDLAEKEIERAVSLHRAKQGAVLVLEVGTGRVLALAKAPSFDPNDYGGESAFARRNFSVIDSFEPGSTLKMMTVAAVMEHSPQALHSVYECPGFIDIADARINCTAVHGSLGVDGIIRHSCNVGVIKMVRHIKKLDLYRTLKAFRFGEKTGVELPGETEGILRPPQQWSGLSKYSIAIGHEVSVTSLQLAAAFAAVGNRGIYVAPQIVEAIENYDGTSVKRFSPQIRGRVAPAEVCERLMKLMRGVVTGGTGRRAASARYCVAGKTGTSQKFIQAKGYSERVVASFVGLAPCERPEVCVVVVIDDPAGGQSGGEIAAPVFANLIDRILANRCAGASRLAPGRLKSRPMVRPRFDGATMPDFTGLRLPEALDLAAEIRRRIPVTLSVRGDGEVHAQKPKAGSKIEAGDEIVLELK